MAQQQQPSQNQKSQTPEKNFDGNSDMGANNPVKKEGTEKRPNRDNSDKANQNFGSEKYRDSNANLGRNDQSAR